MATLVSETTGKRFYPRFDRMKLRRECERLEVELGLYRTASADKTATKTPTRAEKGKAARNSKNLTAREELRRIVAQCAAAVSTPEDFLAELSREGLNPKTTHHADGRVRGYSVALPGDLTADGTPVPYGGGNLAADLTWPKLLKRWASTPPAEPITTTADNRVTPADRRAALNEAAAIVDRAAAAIHDGTEDTDGIAHATGEVLAALTRGTEGHDPGPLNEIADHYDRAARTPHRVLPNRLGPLARDLRRASRRIAAVGALTGRGNERFALLALVLALAGLVTEIAMWQQARGRVHQAAAARRAAGALPAFARPGDSGRVPAHVRRSRPRRAARGTSTSLRGAKPDTRAISARAARALVETVPHARRSPLLRRMLEKIALALGGRPGQRLTRQLAAEVPGQPCCG